MANILVLDKPQDMMDYISDENYRDFGVEIAKDKDKMHLVKRLMEQMSFSPKSDKVLLSYDGNLRESDLDILAMGNYSVYPQRLHPDDETTGMIVVENLIGFGRGGGSAIMEYIIDLAEKENKSVALEAFKDSSSFYRRFDFENIDFTTNSGSSLDMYYYPNGKPEVLKGADKSTRKASIIDKSVAQAVLMTIAEQITL